MLFCTAPTRSGPGAMPACQQFFSVEDRPERVLDLLLRGTGTLANTLRQRWMTHFCPASGKDGFDAVDQPGGAIRDDQHRVAQPALGEPVKEALPSVGGFGPTGLQPDKHWLADRW